MPTESRILVAQALHSVFGQGSRIPDTWNESLASEDATFAQALLGQCLRRWGRLQSFIHSKLADPNRGVPLGTQICLAIGMAQLAWLPGVSDHAAVNEAVELAADRTCGFPPHRGLVNAILRTAAKDRGYLRTKLEELPASLDRTPFVERALTAALAPRGQGHRLEQLWEGLQSPPRPTFLQIKSDPLPEGLEPDPDLVGAFRLASGASFPREWLASGAGMVQDRSSQALMAFLWDRPVKRIADLCAAPGGKTTSLALRWPDAEIIAVEQHPRRARRLEDNLRTRGLRARIVVEDAVRWLDSTDITFDVLLLDAPCSGSGTLRKHPELTWLGDDLAMEGLLSLQRSLLESAIPRLAPGGLLIYSVCSWLPMEGIEHQRAALARHPCLEFTAIWPERFLSPKSLFLPNPLDWEGEGFQAFSLVRK